MSRYILLASFLIFAIPAQAQTSALGQLQSTADKSGDALTTDSADKAKATASSAFGQTDGKKTASLDDILSADPSAPRSAHANAALDNIENQPLAHYNADTEDALLQQAAKNKIENRIAAEKAAAAKKGPDMSDIVAGALAGILTQKIMSDMGGGKKAAGSKIKSASSDYQLDCRAQCSSGGCSWGGETFTDPATGREACICGCDLGR